jgi:hypothetical protein
VHSDAASVTNNRWKKDTLSPDDLKKIKPFLYQISTLKQQGLTGFGVVASYLRRRVQPLMEREKYGFKYTSAEDPSWMVPTAELTEDQVLDRL